MTIRKHLITCGCVMLLCTGCADSSSKIHPKPSLITNDSNISGISATDTDINLRDANRDYSAQSEWVNYQEHLTYDGSPIALTYRIQNEGQAFDQAFLMFVNGRRVPYATNAEPEIKAMHTIHLDEEAETEITLYLEPYGCRNGENALVCIEEMLNPDFMLPDTSYVNFKPHHKISGIQPFSVEIRQDAPDADTFVSDVQAEEVLLTEELEQPFVYDDPVSGEKTSQLDNMTVLECCQSDPKELYMQAEGQLTLKVRGLGVNGKYLVGIYVDHRLQKAFDGKEYAVLNVERTKIKTLHPVIDMTGMTGLHHIYMIAVPYDASEDHSKNYPLKTDTRLLQIGKEDPPAVTGTTAQSVTVPSDDPAETVVSRGIIRFGVLENGTVIARDPGSVTAIGADGSVNGTASVSGVSVMQLLDNGFALIDNRNADIQIYDQNCALIRQVHPPKADNARYIVSGDGKRIAYAYTDYEHGNTSYLITDSIDLNDRKTVFTAVSSETVGAFQCFDSLISYRSGRIAFNGSVLTKLKPETDCASCYGSVSEDGSGFWHHTLGKLQFLSTNLSFEDGDSDWFVILQDYDNPLAKQGNQIFVESVRDGSRKTVTCGSSDETHFAAVSKDGRWLASAAEASLQIYDTESGETVFRKALSAAATEIAVSGSTGTVYWLENGTLKSDTFGEDAS